MSERKRVLDELMSSLKRQRDELKLQIHLGKSEVREQWSQLEKKWDQLVTDYEPVKDAVGETTENVAAGLELIAGEVKHGLKRVKQLLDEERKA